MVSNDEGYISGDSTYSDNMDESNVLDEVLQLYEDAVFEEKNLISATPYDLKSNGLKSFYCGLSPARAFEPVVLLVNTMDISCNISFNIYEWSIFIEHLNQMYHQLVEEGNVDNQQCLKCGEYVKLTFVNSEGFNHIAVSRRNTTFYLSAADVYEILSMDWIISQRLFILNNMNFLSYYNNFLDVINKLVDRVNSNIHAENLIYAFCDISPSPEVYCIRECMYYIKDKVLNDLDNRRYVL